MTVLWLLHKFGGGIQFKPLRIEQSKQELEKSNHQLKSTCQFLQALTQKKHYQRRTLSHVLVSKYADHLPLNRQHLMLPSDWG